MFILIPSTTYYAEVDGAVIRSVQCESCGDNYEYPLWRQAKASEGAVFLLSRAKRIADEKAIKALKWKLEHEHDPVPCPACGWHQSHIVDAIRKSSYSGLKNLGGGFLTLAGVIGGVMLVIGAFSVFAAKKPLPATEDLQVCGIIVAALAVPGLLLRGLRSLLLLNYNPNI